jgi:hypothetical protein
MENRDFVYVITLSTQPTEKDNVGCDGLYFRSMETYVPEMSNPVLLPYKSVFPGFVPSAADLEAGKFRLEWSGRGEFHRFYGTSKQDAANKWNEFCRFQNNAKIPSRTDKK